MSEAEVSEIIKGLKKNKKTARNKIYAAYSNKLFGICLRYADSREEAEDILHDSFIKIFTKINQLKDKSSFEAWIKQITRNTAIQFIREKIYSRNKLKDFKEETNKDISSQIFETPKGLNPKQIMDLLQKLPQGYKLVFNMFVFEDMSHKQIANQLGVSENTSKSQYFRAKKYLNKLIEEQYKNYSK